MTKQDGGEGEGGCGIWIQALLSTHPVSCSASGPALRFLDKKRVSVQQGSPFGHGWECDGKEWARRKRRRMTSHEVKKAQLFASLSEVREDRGDNAGTTVIVEKIKTDGCKPAPFMETKTP